MENLNNKNKFISLIFIILVIFILLILYSRYIGVKGLKVKEYRIESQILTDNFSGIKIIHISDLLYLSTVDQKDVNSLVKKVNILKPDIVVFTGDLISNGIKLNNKQKKFLVVSLNNINAKIGKYIIKGDYDYNDSYDEILSKIDFVLLNNSYDEIYYKDNRKIYITGIPSIQKENINLEQAFEFYKDDERYYTICLVHEGNTIKYIDKSEYEVDLILGGHSLNGSVVLPFYGPLFIPKESNNYYYPYYKKGIREIFISSGIGTSKHSYRFMNKPSINLYRLKSK